MQPHALWCCEESRNISPAYFSQQNSVFFLAVSGSVNYPVSTVGCPLECFGARGQNDELCPVKRDQGMRAELSCGLISFLLARSAQAWMILGVSGNFGLRKSGLFSLQKITLCGDLTHSRT